MNQQKNNKSTELTLAFIPLSDWTMDMTWPSKLTFEIFQNNSNTDCIHDIFGQDAPRYEALFQQNKRYFLKRMIRPTIQEDLTMRKLFAIVCAVFSNGFNCDEAKKLEVIIHAKDPAIKDYIETISGKYISWSSFFNKNRIDWEYEHYEIMENDMATAAFMAEMNNKILTVQPHYIKTLREECDWLYNANSTPPLSKEELGRICSHIHLDNPYDVSTINLEDYLNTYFRNAPADVADDAWDFLIAETHDYINQKAPLLHAKYLYHVLTQEILLNAFDNFYSSYKLTGDALDDVLALVPYISTEILFNYLSIAKEDALKQFNLSL